ncbi:MAG: AAA family ATPase [Clostridia bacterium]|nr:AAA family ATPase [Clostridia bacterium]
MGIFVNPGNASFAEALNSKIYVDKSGLISVINDRLKTKQKYICVSRPRRFGKSLNLEMLAAYYSKGCDSRRLFDNLVISKTESYAEYLNKYNVIYLNMQDFLSISKSMEEMIEILTESLMIDFEDCFPDVKLYPRFGLSYNLKRIYESTKKVTVEDNGGSVTEYEPFVFLIDEWDCIMRENMDNKDAQKTYLDFIRNLLKDKPYVALAYMTGILPIKKYGTHS